jgi:hypothetical protein
MTYRYMAGSAIGPITVTELVIAAAGQVGKAASHTVNTELLC